MEEIKNDLVENYETKGDGNCLIHALTGTYKLDSQVIENHNHSSVRKNLVEYIKKNIDDLINVTNSKKLPIAISILDHFLDTVQTNDASDEAKYYRKNTHTFLQYENQETMRDRIISSAIENNTEVLSTLLIQNIDLQNTLAEILQKDEAYVMDRTNQNVVLKYLLQNRQCRAYLDDNEDLKQLKNSLDTVDGDLQQATQAAILQILNYYQQDGIWLTNDFAEIYAKMTSSNVVIHTGTFDQNNEEIVSKFLYDRNEAALLTHIGIRNGEKGNHFEKINNLELWLNKNKPGKQQDHKPANQNIAGFNINLGNNTVEEKHILPLKKKEPNRDDKVEVRQYLNLHPLIKEKPTFWQTCFDKPFEESKTIEELRKIISNNSDNVEMLPSDSEDFLREIFLVKTSLDNIKKNENEAEEVFKARKNVECENILIDRIVPLIKETFPINGYFKEEDRTKLISNLTKYRINKREGYAGDFSIPLLNLYLQFLVRNKFFENEDKINLFSAFHSEIEACEGGMINRLYQYVGSNSIAKIIERDLNQSMERFVIQNNQVHILGFIQKYLFGQKSEDSLAISVASYLPAQSLERLCKEAINGDFTEKLFRREIVNYLKTILEISDEELAEKFGENNKWKIFNYTLGENTYGANLKNLLTSFVNTISNNSRTSKEKVNEGDYELFGIPESAMSIFANEGIINSKNERNILVEQKGNFKQASYQIIDQAFKEIVKEIKDKVSNLDYAKDTIVINEEDRKKLDTLGEIYSAFLGSITYLTQEQFVGKLLSVKGLVDKKVEEGKTTFSLREDSNIPEEIKNYINQRLDEIYLDNNNKIYLKKEDSSLKHLMSCLKSNQGFLNTYLTDTSLNLDSLLTFNKLYCLINNPLSEYKSNAESLKGKAIFNLANPNSLNLFKIHVLADQFAKLVGNGIVTIPPIENKNISDGIIKGVIEICGPSLIKEFPDKVIDLLGKIENEQLFCNILNSAIGQFLAEKHPNNFVDLLDKIQEGSSISKALQSKAGQVLADKNPDQFIDISKKLKSSSFVIDTFTSASGQILAEKHLDKFVGVVKKSHKNSISGILSSSLGKIMAEKHPDQFIDILNTISDGNCIGDVIKGASGKTLIEKNQDKFISFIKETKSENFVCKLLSGYLSISLLKANDNLKIVYLEVFDKIVSKKDDNLFKILGSKEAQNLAELAPKKVITTLSAALDNKNKNNNKLLEKFLSLSKNIFINECKEDSISKDIFLNLLSKMENKGVKKDLISSIKDELNNQSKNPSSSLNTNLIDCENLLKRKKEIFKTSNSK